MKLWSPDARVVSDESVSASARTYRLVDARSADDVCRVLREHRTRVTQLLEVAATMPASGSLRRAIADLREHVQEDLLHVYAAGLPVDEFQSGVQVALEQLRAALRPRRGPPGAEHERAPLVRAVDAIARAPRSLQRGGCRVMEA